MELAAPYARNLLAQGQSSSVLALQRALAACSDRQLLALIDATDTAPQVDPGWIVEFEAMLLWEWNRRTGYEYRLRLPETVASEWVIVMRKVFDRGSPAVRALFNALVGLPTSRVGAEATEGRRAARRSNEALEEERGGAYPTDG